MLSVSTSLINLWMSEAVLWNLVSVSWHLNPSQRRAPWISSHSFCFWMCNFSIVAKQRVGRHVTAATNARKKRCTFGSIDLHVVHACKREDRWLVLPKTIYWLTRITGVLVFVHRSDMQKLENTTFRKLDMCSFSGGRRKTSTLLGPLESANFSHWT
jgi:hypothetical protein